MNTNLSYSRRNRSISSSHSQYSSNGGIKLRTVLKSRGDHHSRLQDERYLTPSKRQSMTDFKIDTVKNKMSSSMRIDNNSKLSMNSSVHSMKSTSRNSIRKQQTLNCQQQLLGKQDFQFIYHKLMTQLHQLEKQTDFLIQAKIRKVSKKSRLITLKDKGKDEYTQKIQELINKIRLLKSDDLEKFGKKQQRVRHFIDRKIQILQKLMAESTTQSDVLKKYFFAISAKKSQQKLGKINQKIKKTNAKFFLQPLGRSKTQARQERTAIYKQSSNQQDYPAPKQNEYETFRYRAKGYSANLQPLPRSSYKKDYLIYAAGSGKESPIKNLDSYTVIDKSRVKTSTYSQDYQSMKADVVNYKQLDSYKNKIKDLQIKFINKNRRQQSNKQFQQSKKYMIQQLQMSIHSKLPRPSNLIDPKTQTKASKTKTVDLTKAIGSTQSKREYKGYQKEIVSNIKHKRLHNLRYAYKTLANQ